MGLKPVALTPAQLREVWGAPTPTAGAALVARIAGEPDDFDEEPRTAIWVEFMYQAIIFAKEKALSPPKAIAFFTVMQETNINAIATMASKGAAFQFFADRLLAATKELPPKDRFTLPEVEQLLAYARTTYLSAVKLHLLVFTEPQVIRASKLSLFVQTPAVPLPLADAKTAAEVEAEAAAAEAAAAEAAAAPAPEAPAEPAPAAEPAAAPASAEPALENAELAAAINKAVAEQVSALQAGMEAEYAAQEKQMLERIASLETKLK